MKHLNDNILPKFRNVLIFGEGDNIFLYFLAKGRDVARFPRATCSEGLVKKYSKRPNICFVRVKLSLQYFRSHIGWTANEAGSGLSIL